MSQQPLLILQTSTEASERPIRTNDAMAGHHDGNRVCPVGGAHCPARARAANPGGQFPVTARRARGNRSQRLPNLTLERRAGGGSFHFEEGPDIAIEIVLQRSLYRNRHLAFLKGV